MKSLSPLAEPAGGSGASGVASSAATGRFDELLSQPTVELAS